MSSVAVVTGSLLLNYWRRPPLTRQGGKSLSAAEDRFRSTVTASMTQDVEAGREVSSSVHSTVAPLKMPLKGRESEYRSGWVRPSEDIRPSLAQSSRQSLARDSFARPSQGFRQSSGRSKISRQSSARTTLSRRSEHVTPPREENRPSDIDRNI